MSGAATALSLFYWRPSHHHAPPPHRPTVPAPADLPLVCCRCVAGLQSGCSCHPSPHRQPTSKTTDIESCRPCGPAVGTRSRARWLARVKPQASSSIRVDKPICAISAWRGRTSALVLHHHHHHTTTTVHNNSNIFHSPSNVHHSPLLRCRCPARGGDAKLNSGTPHVVSAVTALVLPCRARSGDWIDQDSGAASPACGPVPSGHWDPTLQQCSLATKGREGRPWSFNPYLSPCCTVCVAASPQQSRAPRRASHSQQPRHSLHLGPWVVGLTHLDAATAPITALWQPQLLRSHHA